MANYFNITLDTTAPGGVGVKINGDEVRTVSTEAILSITCSDADKTGYKMKVWGDIVKSNGTVITESNAAWEDFSATKAVTLLEAEDNDNQRIVYVKVRDDLHNESAAASDSIILYTELPEINILAGPTPARITTRSDKHGSTPGELLLLVALSRSVVTFTSNKDLSDIKVMLTSSVNALHNDATNMLIPSAGESQIAIASESEEAENGFLQLSGEDGMTVSGQNIAAGTEISLVVSGDDLKIISPTDGVKLIKIFVKEKDAHWSV